MLHPTAFSLSIVALALVFVWASACRKSAPAEPLAPSGGTAVGAGAGAPGTAGGGGTADGGADAAARASAGDGDTAGNGAGAPDSGTGGAGGADIVRLGDEVVDGGSPDAPPAFSKTALLAAAAACVLAHASDFELRADALATATQAYATDRTVAKRDRARAAWLDAMHTWQRLELMRLGPAAASTKPGGQGLRDQIYAFPFANACRVDQQLVAQSYARSDFSSSPSGARGLSSIEYLLFHAGSNNACLAGVDINASGTWAALSATELEQRRADYAAAAALDVRTRARALHDAWDPAQGDFVAQLTLAGERGSPYTAEQMALDALNEAIFYIDKELKDYKLGWPLGYVPECTRAPDTCPTEVESRYARVSTDHLRQNLFGFRRLFVGCGAADHGLGFDDWLRDEGEGELADRMLAALAAAQNAVDALEPPLEQAIFEAPPSKVAALHDAIRAITDPLKTELVTVLNINLPASAQGDND